MRKLIISGLLLGALALSAFAGQPYGACWHPDDIADWSAETYPLLKFNRSRTPLRPRAERSEKMRANENQREAGGITNATILYPHCSAAPSQGDYTFTAYQPTYWQYVDKLVYWAGSASEGIIIPPPAPTIDAAHQEGVKVLGQIFFPPTYFGGKSEWVRQMLTCEKGRYPYAVKLFEIARDLGFDGWFINEETGGGSSDEWVGFFKEFYQVAHAEGFDEMELQWYNASTSPNMNILRTDLNTSQFVEYGPVNDYRSLAGSLGCTEAQVYDKIYNGIECSKAGLTGYSNQLNRAFPVGEDHRTSLALFCQEERTWKDYVRDLLDKEDTGEKAYAAVAKVFDAEQLQWVNRSGDPSAIDDGWRGISGAIQERSAITSLPFTSDMCVGLGKHRFVKGEKRGSRDWHHSGVQSVLPTWRWWIENRGDLNVTVDWDNAYNMGSSFLFSGTLTPGDHNVRLYRTSITLPERVSVKVIFKGEVPLLIVSADGDLDPDADFDGSDATVADCGNGWMEATWNLSTLAGKHIDMVGLNLRADSEIEDYSFNLGSLRMLSEQDALESVRLRNVKADGEMTQSLGAVALTWDYDPTPMFDRFDVYMGYGGDRSLVGQTRGEAFYIPEFSRVADSDVAEFEVVAVYRDMTEDPAEKVEVSFPSLETPTLSFKLSRSYVKVGEEFELTAKAGNFADRIEWTLPAGLEKTGQPDDFTLKLKGTEEGRHSVKATVWNKVGETTREEIVADVLSQEDYDKVGNVMRTSKVHSYSGSANSSEVPENLIDGVTNPRSVSNKWCTLDPENWVIFDCGSSRRFYGFKVYDCKAGPEDAENFHSYSVELSDDLETWRTVIDERDLAPLNIKEDYMSPSEGRYVRFSPKVAGVLRVWEFEGYAGEVVTLNVEAPSEAPEVITGIYTADGRRLGNLTEGLNIVVYSGGRVEKVLVRGK